jgi:thymidine phosphorylase
MDSRLRGNDELMLLGLSKCHSEQIQMSNNLTTDKTEDALNFLQLRRMHIDTHQEPVVYMRKDCHVCRAEGFYAHTRVTIKTDTSQIIATVNVVTDDSLSHQEAGLSESAWSRLNAKAGERASFCHAKPAESMAHVRAKIYGNAFNDSICEDIIFDITRGFYSDIQLAAFVTACGGNRLNQDEIISLTKAMINAGSRLDWGKEKVMDKHCVGGLPGNRTTPLIVAIVAAAGLIMPKTSSRAITSPAGTADTMETLAPVNLSISGMRKVVEQEGGCIAWGGSVSLSPADDILIQVERAIDLDSEGQLVASVLSKKIAAGSTHVLIDLPIGVTAKVRNQEYAFALAKQLRETGENLGLTVSPFFSDGQQPVGKGIGPALEARDILAIFQNQAHAPKDLENRALILAGKILEMGGAAQANQGFDMAQKLLQSGVAWSKFQAICEAQGGMRTPGTAPFTHTVNASKSGMVTFINNRFVSKLAKLAGAPSAPSAGLDFHIHLGQNILKGEPLFDIHAETQGELTYALDFLQTHLDDIRIEEEVL